MDWKTREWILEIMGKARALTEAAKDFDEECNQQGSFDFQGDRASFDEIKRIIGELDQMLVEDEELAADDQEE